MEQTTPYNYKKEIIILLLLFLIITTTLKIVFYNEQTFETIKTTSALFWIFILPGYCTTLIWKQETSLTERFIIGIPISAVLIGITSYYLGLTGLNLKIHVWLLPTTIIIMTLFTTYLKHKNKT